MSLLSLLQRVTATLAIAAFVVLSASVGLSQAQDATIPEETSSSEGTSSSDYSSSDYSSSETEETSSSDVPLP